MKEDVQLVGSGPMSDIVAQLPPNLQEEFVARVGLLQQAAVKMQGLEALASERHDAAAHEAGHAVLYASLGIPVVSIEISPKQWPTKVPEALGREYWGGLTMPEMEPREIGYQTPPHLLFEEGLTLIAGWTGEKLLRGAKFRAGSSADEFVLADFVLSILAELRGMSSFKVIEIAKREAKSRLNTNMGALNRVEAALLRHRCLDREQVAHLLEDVKVEALTAASLQ